MAFNNFAKATMVINGVTFCEVSIKPPGVAAGDDLDITTSCSTGAREKEGSAFYEITEASMTAKYEPSTHTAAAIAAITGEAGKGSCVITFPDTATLTWTGWLKTYEPSDNATNEDSFPTAAITVGCDGTLPAYAAGT